MPKLFIISERSSEHWSLKNNQLRSHKHQRWPDNPTKLKKLTIEYERVKLFQGSSQNNNQLGHCTRLTAPLGVCRLLFTHFFRTVVSLTMLKNSLELSPLKPHTIDRANFPWCPLLLSSHFSAPFKQSPQKSARPNSGALHANILRPSLTGMQTKSRDIF